jgi:tetratricopeptide (TPR) repeat protein
MCLKRFINYPAAAAALLLSAVLGVAGCATSNPEPATDVDADVAPAMVAGQATLPLAPAGAVTMFEQATAAMATDDFAAAERLLQQFLQSYPSYAAAYVNLAIIYASNDDDAAVQQAIDAALAVDPAYAPALNQQGLLFRRNGKFLEAEAAYLKAVTASPDYALAHYNLGVLNELYLQRLDIALQHFERYQELVGEDKQVEKWILDLKRRLAASQRTADVAE